MAGESNPSLQHRKEIVKPLMRLFVGGCLVGVLLGGATFAQDSGQAAPETDVSEVPEQSGETTVQSPVASPDRPCCLMAAPLLPPRTTSRFTRRLRALRDRLIAAYEKRDMDALLQELVDDVVITWQNSERNEGHQEFREFYDRMMNGDSRVVKDISSTVEVDADSVLYEDDTAVARGTVSDKFSLADGSEFTLNSKWTATVVKKDDRWKVASFHVSANIFDNPILDTAKAYLGSAALIGSVVGGLVGLLLGWILGRMFRRKATQP